LIIGGDVRCRAGRGGSTRLDVADDLGIWGVALAKAGGSLAIG